MNAQARDRWLKVLLPALLTAGVYIWMYGRPGTRGLAEQKAAAVKAHETAPRPGDLLAKQVLAEELNDKVEAEKQRHAKLQAHAAASAGQKKSESQSKTILDLSNLLAEHSLHLVSSGQAVGMHGNSAMQDEVVQLCKARGLPAPQFWRVEVQGTYPNVLNALKQLSTKEHAAVPVLIEMNAGGDKPRDPDDPVQTWAMVVWI